MAGLELELVTLISAYPQIVSEVVCINIAALYNIQKINAGCFTSGLN